MNEEGPKKEKRRSKEKHHKYEKCKGIEVVVLNISVVA